MDNKEKIVKALSEPFCNRKQYGSDGQISIYEKKNILIIGAGVSNEVAGLPLGTQLAEVLVQKMGCNTGENKILYEKYLDEMEAQCSFRRDDFKTILFSLSKINQSKLIKSIKEELREDCINGLVYQYVADMLKRKYVDAVINFNFDEILDREIASIFNGHDYAYIYSENSGNEYLSALREDAGKGDLGIYIKPHGTIGISSSMRFLREDYYRIEPSVSKSIELVLGSGPVNVFIVGFRIKYSELTTIMTSALHKDSEIFIIDKSDDVIDYRLSANYHGTFLKIDEQSLLTNIVSVIYESVINTCTL